MLGGSSIARVTAVFSLTFKTQALLTSPFTPYQVELSDEVLRLRDSFGLTFKEIADRLVKQGYKGARGGELGPESVFSIYKKRTRRNDRKTKQVTWVITDFRTEIDSDDSIE